MRESQSKAGSDEPLPRLRAPGPPEAIVAKLDEAAKRGKLPEFEPGEGAGGAGKGLFSMLAYGTPWDADLIGEVEDGGGAGDFEEEAGAAAADESREPPGATAGQTTLRFRLELRRRMPLISAALLVLTVEPGRYFMDEFLATFIPSLHGHVPTWWWWYPLTIIPIPWLWRGWLRKSRKTTRENARERIGQMREIVGGELVQ